MTLQNNIDTRQMKVAFCRGQRARIVVNDCMQIDGRGSDVTPLSIYALASGTALVRPLLHKRQSDRW